MPRLCSFSIALNAISEHATCTVVFVVVGAVIVAGLSSIRTLGNVAFLAWIGLASILSAVLTLAIAVSQQNRPSAAPPTGPWNKDIRVIGDATFLEAISAVSNVVFSYAGTGESQDVCDICLSVLSLSTSNLLQRGFRNEKPQERLCQGSLYLSRSGHTCLPGHWWSGIPLRWSIRIQPSSWVCRTFTQEGLLRHCHTRTLGRCNLEHTYTC